MKLASRLPPSPGAPSALAQAVAEAFVRRPRRLPPWLLRDDRGARLFARLVDSPDYYLASLERDILQSCAVSIAAEIPRNRPIHVVELPAASAPRTEILLHAMRNVLGPVHYVPIDLCASPLDSLRSRLLSHMPSVAVEPWLCDTRNALPRIGRLQGSRVVLMLGGMIGAYDELDPVALLSSLRDHLEPGDTVVLGTDAPKDPEVMIRAHDDSGGLAAALHKNALSRINCELGGHFPVERFHYEALWNPRASCIEQWLESRVHQLVHVDSLGISVALPAGERLQTGVSPKYDRATLDAVLDAAGFCRELAFSDPHDGYTVSVARPN